MDLRELREFLIDSLKYIIVILGVFILFVYVFSLHQVSGDSMTPNYKNGDVLFLSKMRYKITTVKRFDVVVVKTDDGKIFIKRVIGLPGETVKHMDNLLYINDEIIPQEFLASNVNTSNFMFTDICDKNKCPNGVIPDNMYLILGDNREDSYDSRNKTLGLISKKNIVGKTTFKIWPLF